MKEICSKGFCEYLHRVGGAGTEIEGIELILDIRIKEPKAPNKLSLVGKDSLYVENSDKFGRKLLTGSYYNFIIDSDNNCWIGNGIELKYVTGEYLINTLEECNYNCAEIRKILEI